MPGGELITSGGKPVKRCGWTGDGKFCLNIPDDKHCGKALLQEALAKRPETVSRDEGKVLEEISDTEACFVKVTDTYHRLREDHSLEDSLALLALDILESPDSGEASFGDPQ
ncbi:hypothetical protein FWD20_02330 [Candidatus Saccharibacteria bacterium]|nr:hypothetical protein [Candidatus Saccharibacteria bacterium]